MSRLVVISEGLTGLSHELGPRWVTIGRADRNDFQIVEASVSSLHCEAQLRGNELIVRDLRSTNGTFIGGKTVVEAVLLPGQILRLGEVELRLEISTPASPATAPAATGIPSPAPPKNEAGDSGGKIHRVLFVDDSMAFLEMVTDLFGSQTGNNWEIHTAFSADKALTILQQKLIDLVVLDIGMPLLDGIQLLGLIHQRYPNIKKVVLTGESDDSHRAACLAGGAELYLLKPVTDDGWRVIFNLLTSLLRWDDRDDFVSAMSETELYNVIQLECLDGNSSVLEIRNPQTDGEIYIESGAIIHASAGKLAGKKAFHQLLSLNDGEFRLIPFRAPSQHTIQLPWETLLAEAARARKDENYPADDDETILITKKSVVKKAISPPPSLSPAVTPPSPPPPPPAEPPHSKVRRVTSGMDFITLEEMVESDTSLISNPDRKGPASDGPEK